MIVSIPNKSSMHPFTLSNSYVMKVNIVRKIEYKHTGKQIYRKL